MAVGNEYGSFHDRRFELDTTASTATVIRFIQWVNARQCADVRRYCSDTREQWRPLVVSDS